MKYVLKFFPLLCFVTSSAIAYPSGTQFGVGLSVTTGLNAFAGFVNKNAESFWGKRFGYRIDFAGTKIIRSRINSAINRVMDGRDIEVGDYLCVQGGEIDAKHFGGMVDFYPFGNTWFLGGWRLSGGYYSGQFNAWSRMAEAGGPGEFNIGNSRYWYGDGVLRAGVTADWKYDGPYVGTGFDLGLIAGFKIYLDAGIVFTRKVATLNLDVPEEDLYQWNGLGWNPVDVEALARDKENALYDVQHDVDKVKYFPIVKLGLMYRF